MLTTVCGVAPAAALDPQRAMSQYIRDQWGIEKGFPGGRVYAIAQTVDGYLWIASDKGLVRFDGFTFRLIPLSGVTTEPGSSVLGLASDAAGTLWARLQGPALARYQNGAFENMLAGLDLPDSLVTAMTPGNDGTMLLATLGRGAVAYRMGQFSTIAAQTVMSSSFVISMAQTSEGDVWLGTRDSGLLRVQGQRVTPITTGLPDVKINCLLKGDNHDLWIGTDNGVVRWNGTSVTAAGLPATLGRVRALAMARDRDANIWLATASHGLIRMNAHGVTSMGTSDTGAGGTITAVFEDRDRNLWVGTTEGIERWRNGVFTTYATAQGLPSDSAGPVYVDATRTWFAPSRGGLYWLRNGHVERIVQAGLAEDVIYSIAGDGSDVWVGRQRGGLTRLRGQGDAFTAERFTHADGLAQDSVYAVYRARDGAVWAGTLSGGASRLKNGAFTSYTVTNGLASNTISSILETADGTMWFATPTGVSVLSRGGWRRYTTRDGLPSNEVNTLVEDSAGHVWAGTSGGLALISAGQVERTFKPPDALRRSILGLTDDRAGWLWIVTTESVVRVSREQLVHGAPGPGDVREYGLADGLLSLEGVKRHRSVTSDSSGRIWLSMNRGLSMADAARAVEPALPALTHVEDLSADGKPIDLTGGARIPSGRQRIALGYTGLSLSVPERIKFRYRLDGFDRDWSEAVTDRRAEYTNLGPGPYQFRVMASNSDGLWSGAEAAIRFEIEPRFWQTVWFRLSALMLCAMIGWSMYRLRVIQVARQLNVRFEERLAERTRIAQELHDTLLQGFMSASMQLHVAADGLPQDSPARASLSRVLDLMSRVIEEGRNAVRGLRSSSSSSHDLEQALSTVSEELRIGDQIDYRVIVEGHPRALNPIIRDEVYRIGREALANAFRHSGAKAIEVELEYASTDLRMLVRDNGCGIDARVLHSGSEGHWGLSGMRERAVRIGARFRVLSRDNAGTEVELTVPASVAFIRQAHGRWGAGAAGLFRFGRRRRVEERMEKDS